MLSTRDTIQMNDELWQAITHNDQSYDQIFIYAVKSTGICCRPSCKSRNPKKENVHIFQDVEAALSAGFRPCKRCKPGGKRLPDEDWVVQIREYINSNYHESMSLEILADICHGSPFHLQRTFKRIIGVTPTEYIQQVRISNAIKELSAHNKSIAEVGSAIGLPNTPYFITLFKKRTGQTPKQFQKTMMDVKVNGEN